MSVGSPKGSTKGLLADPTTILDFESMSFYAAESTMAIQSSKQVEQEESKRKMTRRSRRQKTKVNPEEKTFKCGCGKSYLSYAALYTHCKVKHTGIFPEGTIAGEKKKQGRPRVRTFYQERGQC